MHLQNGVDIRTLMRWAGHEDLATTQQYLDWLDAHSDEARLAVNKTFASAFAPLTLQLAGATSEKRAQTRFPQPSASVRHQNFHRRNLHIVLPMITVAKFAIALIKSFYNPLTVS
jgi:hypothetical protein